jgi:hypothetical protein
VQSPAREREAPIAQRWEGEAGAGRRSGIPHFTPALSASRSGEGAILQVFVDAPITERN